MRKCALIFVNIPIESNKDGAFSANRYAQISDVLSGHLCTPQVAAQKNTGSFQPDGKAYTTPSSTM